MNKYAIAIAAAIMGSFRPPATAPTTLRYPKPLPVKRRVNVKIDPSTAEICPGGRHAWFQSNVGRIRKPISAAPINL